MARKNLLGNPSFEDSTSSIAPWTSDSAPGFSGVNFPEKGTEAQDGNNFLFLVSSNIAYSVGQQVEAVKKGHLYNLSYAAYAFPPPGDPNPDRPCNWTVQLGPKDILTDFTPTVFNNSNLSPQDWPYWVHTFNATDDNLAVAFVQQNDSVLFLDRVALECVSCPAASDVGKIVGGLIGGLAGLGLLLLGCAFLWLRVVLPRRRAREVRTLALEKGGLPPEMAPSPPAGSIPGVYATLYRSARPSAATSTSNSRQSVLTITKVHTDLSKPDEYPEYSFGPPLAYSSTSPSRSDRGGGGVTARSPNRTAQRVPEIT